MGESQTPGKECPVCRTLLPAEAFSIDNYRRDGLAYKCKACQKARYERWYAANRERHIADVQAWRVANPDTYREINRKPRRKKAANE